MQDAKKTGRAVGGLSGESKIESANGVNAVLASLAARVKESTTNSRNPDLSNIRNNWQKKVTRSKRTEHGAAT